MKLLLILVLLGSSQVFASKARLQALSQGENGSYYVEDARNVFLNPAKAFKFGKWANFEWGSSTTPSTPNAEGGIFYEVGTGVLGLQLGRESDAQTMISTVNSITPSGTFAFLYPQNTVNLVYASKSTVAWGVQLLFGSAQQRDEITTVGTTEYPNKTASTFELGFGSEGDNYDFHAKINLRYSAETEASSTLNHKLEGKPGIRLGGTYGLDNANKVYGELSQGGADANYTDSTVKKEIRTERYLLGLAHYINPESDVKFYLSPAFEINNTKISDGLNGIGQNTELMNIPATIGMEMAASDWLDLRASVTQRVLLDDKKTTVSHKHDPNTTSVAAGVGVKWKKLTLDGTLRGAVDTSQAGRLDGNSLLSNVGMTYVF